MRYIVAFIGGVVLWCSAPGAQEYIFGTSVKNSAVQATGVQIGGLYKFTVSDDGTYKILTAWFVSSESDGITPGTANQTSQQVVRTAIKGIELQEFVPSPESYIRKFNVSLVGGYWVLAAETRAGQTGAILQTKIKRTQVQAAAVTIGPFQGITQFVTQTAGDYRNLGIAVTPFSTELVEWEAYYLSGEVKILWIVEGQFDVGKWIVERRKENDRNYVIISEVPGHLECRNYSAIDNSVTGPMVYWYRLSMFSSKDTVYYGEKMVCVPGKTSPSAGVSNPFANKIDIHYTIPQDAKVRVRVYDVSGQYVCTIIDEEKEAGNYRLSWDGKDDENRRVRNGVYFVRFEMELPNKRFDEFRKVVLMRK